MALERSNCVNHADRYGHAVCMTCKRTVCQECATDWDGVYYCSACLAKRRKSSRQGAPVLGWLLVLLVISALWWMGPKVLVWGATVLQRSFG